MKSSGGWCGLFSLGASAVRVRAWLFGFFMVALPLSVSASLSGSVVKVSVVRREYDYRLPWASPTLSSKCFGSGFIIKGNHILTNAHVVADASFIEVHAADSKRKYEASVKAIGHDCDLALLEVADSQFFQGKECLTISECMATQEGEVQLYGFPVGGEELAITKGIVSRIEMDHYVHSGAVLLTSQIDAPVNPGNSGGPVILGGKVVGVVHEGCALGQRIGYMIPVPIVRRFLLEVERGSYRGFPQFPLAMQAIQNSSMRKCLGLGDNMGGLLIIHVPENHFLYDVVKVGDILVGVDGHDIDSSGCIYYQKEGLSLPFRYTIIMKYFGDSIELDVLREGELLHFTTQMDYYRRGQPLVKSVEYDKTPTYYILGGMVYQPLVGNFLSQQPFSPSLIGLFCYFLTNMSREGKAEVVVLTRVLDDVVNGGYQGLENEVVKSVNGCDIRNIQEMVDVCSKCSDPYYEIVTENGVRIVLDRDKTAERDPEILRRYFIPSDRSDDLKNN